VATSVWERCRDAVALKVESLGLEGIPAARVYRQMLPDASSVDLPAVLVTLEGCQEEVALWDTVRNMVIYPVAVHLAHRLGPDQHGAVGQWLGWRQPLVNGFSGTRLAGVAENYQCEVAPQPVLLERPGAYQWAEGPLQVRCLCLVTRG
jgi:hypothetical protein